MTWVKRLKNVIKIIWVMFFMVSCSYSFTGASISPEVKTVSVDYFKSMAQQAPPVLEQSFTEALRDIFISQTNLKLIDGVGDLHFEGKITGYGSKAISVSTDQVANAERLTITVRVRFINSKEPKNNFDRTFSKYQDYDATKNLQDIENDLIKDINQQLVQSIFDAAVSNW
jgi:hypothetical protein